jgi:hypothetical protein
MNHLVTKLEKCLSNGLLGDANMPDNQILSRLRYTLLTMRPSHWVKNLFVFAGLIFSRNLFETSSLLKVSLGFVLFSLASSSVYVFNDIRISLRIEITRRKQ